MINVFFNHFRNHSCASNNASLYFSLSLLPTGTVDRLGRALIVAQMDAADISRWVEEVARLLACFYKMTQ